VFNWLFKLFSSNKKLETQIDRVITYPKYIIKDHINTIDIYENENILKNVYTPYSLGKDCYCIYKPIEVDIGDHNFFIEDICCLYNFLKQKNLVIEWAMTRIYRKNYV